MTKYLLVKMTDTLYDDVELSKEELIAIHTLIQIPKINVDVPYGNYFVRTNTNKIRKVIEND